MRAFAWLGALGLALVAGCGGSTLPYVPAAGGGGGGGVSNFSINGGGTQTVNPGGTATFNVGVGFAGQGPANPRTPLAVSLSTTGLPTHATPSFSPNPVVPNDPPAASVLTVTTNAQVAPGTYNFTISGTDGVNTRTLAATLTVRSQAERFLVTINTLDGEMTNQDGYPFGDDPSANYQVTVTAPEGYQGNARLEWRFVEQGAPTQDDILGVWHYGLEQSGTTLEYTVGPNNRTDSAECTLQRQRNMTITGVFRVEFRVVPLSGGLAPETTEAEVNIRLNEGGGARPR